MLNENYTNVTYSPVDCVFIIFLLKLYLPKYLFILH